jgi:twitching motility protein PilT
MDAATFNQLLRAAVNNGGSDIHFKVASPPAIRIGGGLRNVKAPALAPEDLERIAAYVLEQARWRGRSDELNEVDTSYSIDGVARFRVSIFRQKGHLAAVMRTIPFEVPTFAGLGLPAVVDQIANEERGMILVTGITGSGKTSTLAAFIDAINTRTRKHIITIEDPIEFLHADKNSRVTQREIGSDTRDFASALRAALRQDPDVIFVGEMRDHETVDIALKAAETGHLVLSSLHTFDVARTISRIVGVFPADAEAGVRARLAESLKAVISQRLLPLASGKGRVLAAEVMVTTLNIQEMIRDPARTNLITDYLVKSTEAYGTQTFDQDLTRLYKNGAISLEVACAASSNPSNFQRALAFT